MRDSALFILALVSAALIALAVWSYRVAVRAEHASDEATRTREVA